MIQLLDNFYANKPDSIKGCLLALRTIILHHNEHITETLKYGMPCFCYKKKQFCYLWTDKKTNEPYILFVEGRYIDHPKLETGTRARMKIFRINPEKDLPINTIKGLLKQALDVYVTGKVKIR